MIKCLKSLWPVNSDSKCEKYLICAFSCVSFNNFLPRWCIFSLPTCRNKYEYGCAGWNLSPNVTSREERCVLVSLQTLRWCFAAAILQPQGINKWSPFPSEAHSSSYILAVCSSEAKLPGGCECCELCRASPGSVGSFCLSSAQVALPTGTRLTWASDCAWLICWALRLWI